MYKVAFANLRGWEVVKEKKCVLFPAIDFQNQISLQFSEPPNERFMIFGHFCKCFWLFGGSWNVLCRSSIRTPQVI